jgi:hypothetical protein
MDREPVSSWCSKLSPDAIGQSLFQVRTLAMVSRRYRVDLVPGHPMEPEATITTITRHGILDTLAKH